MPRKPFAMLALAGALLVSAVPLRTAVADSVGDATRTVVTKNRGAVVTLVVILKASGFGGGADNAEFEADGVIIDPSGLVVTTNTAIDPLTSLGRGGGDSNITIRVVGARILTPDGEDIPAKVVLRDSDRNLAFLRPVTPPKNPLPFVDMKSAPKAQIGDPVILLSRFGTVGNRTTKAIPGRVAGVVERPRTLYLLGTSGLTGLGNAAFNEQGQPIGLVTVRSVVSGNRRSFNSDTVVPVVIPAEDILDEAAQAPPASAVKSSTPASSVPIPAPKK